MQLCPIRENGIPIKIQKKIDYVLTLVLTDAQKKQLKNAFTKLAPEHQSLTQCLDTALAYSPIFAYIEVKIINQARDPTVQLAIWIAAGFKKNLQAGYDMTMPVPAISITGDYWDLYVAYWNDGEIIMLGPTEIGNTRNILGAFQILGALTAIGKWGAELYREWFEKVVMARYCESRN